MNDDIKTKLAEIKEWYLKADLEFDGYQSKTVSNTCWLVDQLEQALAREERLKVAAKALVFACRNADANLELAAEINYGLMDDVEEALQSSQGPSGEESKK